LKREVLSFNKGSCSMPIIDIYCPIETDGGMKVLAWKLVKKVSILYVMQAVAFSIANFFVGFGTGGMEIALSFTGYSIAMEVVSVSFVVPGFGFFTIASFPSITSGVAEAMNVSGEFWIDLVVNWAFFASGLVVQIASIIVTASFIAIAAKNRARCSASPF